MGIGHRAWGMGQISDCGLWNEEGHRAKDDLGCEPSNGKQTLLVQDMVISKLLPTFYLSPLTVYPLPITPYHYVLLD